MAGQSGRYAGSFRAVPSSQPLTEAVVAIDGSKFKAVDNGQELHGGQGLPADGEVNANVGVLPGGTGPGRPRRERGRRGQVDPAEGKVPGCAERRALKVMEQTVQDAPDEQVSLTDPDTRSMATSSKGTATVGYKVQIAVDTEHHLIVAHEVINQGYDRHQLAPMALKAQQATGGEQITALADRGYLTATRSSRAKAQASHLSCPGP